MSKLKSSLYSTSILTASSLSTRSKILAAGLLLMLSSNANAKAASTCRANTPLYNPAAEISTKISHERKLLELNYMQPIFAKENSLPLLDLKLKLDNYNSKEVNIGLAYRHNFKDNFILGAYTYFDHRNTGDDLSVNGLTFGVEMLSKYVDVRSNFYLPQNKSKKVANNNRKYLEITGSSIYLLSGGHLYETSLKGYDLEVGVPLFAFSDDLNEKFGTKIYAARYGFTGKGIKPINGTRFRLTQNLMEYYCCQDSYNLYLTAETQSDKIRKRQNFVGIGLKIAFNDRNNRYKRKPGSLQHRMMDTIIRDVDIVTTSSPARQNAQMLHSGGKPHNEQGIVEVDGNMDFAGGGISEQEAKVIFPEIFNGSKTSKKIGRVDVYEDKRVQNGNLVSRVILVKDGHVVVADTETVREISKFKVAARTLQAFARFNALRRKAAASREHSAYMAARAARQQQATQQHVSAQAAAQAAGATRFQNIFRGYAARAEAQRRAEQRRMAQEAAQAAHQRAERIALEKRRAAAATAAAQRSADAAQVAADHRAEVQRRKAEAVAKIKTAEKIQKLFRGNQGRVEAKRVVLENRRAAAATAAAEATRQRTERIALEKRRAVAVASAARVSADLRAEAERAKAAAKIQSIYRSHAAASNYSKFKDAAEMVQRATRISLAKQHVQELKKQKKREEFAAQKLQLLFRGYQVKLAEQAKQSKLEEAAAQTLQNVYRGYKNELELRAVQHQIQEGFDKFSESGESRVDNRKDVLQHKLLLEAQRIVLEQRYDELVQFEQEWYNFQRKSVGLDEDVVKKAVTRIQAMWRARKIAQQRVQKLQEQERKKQLAASQALQSAYHGYPENIAIKWNPVSRNLLGDFETVGDSSVLDRDKDRVALLDQNELGVENVAPNLGVSGDKAKISRLEKRRTSIVEEKKRKGELGENQKQDKKSKSNLFVIFSDLEELKSGVTTIKSPPLKDVSNKQYKPTPEDKLRLKKVVKGFAFPKSALDGVASSEEFVDQENPGSHIKHTFSLPSIVNGKKEKGLKRTKELSDRARSLPIMPNFVVSSRVREIETPFGTKQPENLGSVLRVRGESQVQAKTGGRNLQELFVVRKSVKPLPGVTKVKHDKEGRREED